MLLIIESCKAVLLRLLFSPIGRVVMRVALALVL